MEEHKYDEFSIFIPKTNCPCLGKRIYIKILYSEQCLVRSPYFVINGTNKQRILMSHGHTTLESFV